MNDAEHLKRENDTLRERLSRLSEASLRINESLHLDTVLQDVLDSARSLAGARYGVLAVLDDSEQVEALLASGLAPAEFQGLREIPGGEGFFRYLGSMNGPLRVADFAGHARSRGMAEFLPPVPVLALLAVPIRRLGHAVGHIYVAHSEPGAEFSAEDEETLVTFASQAALVIANARRHQAEQRARADLETLVDTSPVGVVVLDAGTGRALSFNREALRIVDGLRSPGQLPEDLLDSLAIRRADGREEVLAELPLARLMSAGETVRAEEMTLIVPDGRSLSALVNASPVRREEGESSDDGSDRGRVESYVVTLQDLAPLEELGRLRAEFIGMVSQELLAPLASIKGSVDTLLEAAPGLDPAETRQFFDIIRGQSDHMRDLVSDLLDVARIATGGLTVAPEPVELAVLAEEARRRFCASVLRDVSIDLPENLPRVLADRRRMVQALTNLLDSVARSSRKSTVIRVSAEHQDTHVAISVVESGHATARERLPDVFEVLSPTDRTGGDWPPTGTRLAVCRGVVEAHGGRVWEDRESPGQGSRYVFTIPVAEPAPDAVSPPGGSDRGRGNRTAILVVDDDPQSQRYIRDNLYGAGYHPVIASDPAEAQQLLVSESPGLALLDLELTGTDALALMDSLQAIAGVPVVLLSAYGRDQAIAQALEQGASDYLVKPFSPTELAARVGTALRRGIDLRRTDPMGRCKIGDLTIDYDLREVRLAGCLVEFTSMEYDLLRELSANAGRTLTHDQILRRVWRRVDPGQPSRVRSMVKNIRRKLGDDVAHPMFIITEPRVGYRMGVGGPVISPGE